MKLEELDKQKIQDEFVNKQNEDLIPKKASFFKQGWNYNLEYQNQCTNSILTRIELNQRVLIALLDDLSKKIDTSKDNNNSK